MLRSPLLSLPDCSQEAGGPVGARGMMLAEPQGQQDFLPGAPRTRDASEMGKVFVGGLSRETTTDGLRGYFERFGDISDCVVMKDRSTGAPRGFGFVTYASQLVANRVVHHRHVVDGKEVEAKQAVPRDSDSLAPGMPGARGPPPPMPGMPGMPGQLAAPAPTGQAMLPGAQGIVGGPGGFAGGGGGGQFGAQPVAQSQGGGGGNDPALSCKKIFVGGLSHETSESDFVAYFGARARTRARRRSLSDS